MDNSFSLYCEIVEPRSLQFYHKIHCIWFFSRMLVYEYVNNGNLEQWLHGDVGPVSPLTWDIRMKIILGTAKGYALFDFYCGP